MTSLYVAGPMTGYPEWNFPAFEEATEALREHGFEVVSPHEIDLEDGFDPLSDGVDFDLRSALERDVAEVLKADGLALLDGWEESSGATIEVLTASSKGAPSRPVREWLRAARNAALGVASVAAAAAAVLTVSGHGEVVQEAAKRAVAVLEDCHHEILSDPVDGISQEHRHERREEQRVM